MDLGLAGRVVAITGAGGGIGVGIAQAFALEGAHVVLWDRDERLLRQARAAIQESALIDVVDVRHIDLVRSAVERVESEFGRLDVLINNAGVNGLGAVDEITDDEWDFCFDVNVKGVFNTCRAVLPIMKRQRWGRILNAASFAVINPIVGSAAYAASKSAVVQFTRVLAGEVGPWTITANSYAPGMVPTSLNHFLERAESEQSELLDTLTLRRWQTPADVASLLVFLASEHASYITGALMDVSGGKLATQIPRRAYEWATVADPSLTVGP